MTGNTTSNLSAVFLFILTFNCLNSVTKGDCISNKNYKRVANLQQPGMVRAYTMLSWQRCEAVSDLNGWVDKYKYEFDIKA